MKQLPLQTTIDTDFGEIDVTVSYHWESDGIGSYEFWGQRGYDAGNIYPEIDDITPTFGPEDDDEHKENVRNLINNDFETLAEKVSEKIEREVPEDFCDEELDTDANGNCFSDADPGL